MDALVEAVATARTREDLVTATRALDRALWFGHYAVPHWFIDSHRITYWNKLRHPASLPRHYQPGTFLTYWWLDAGAEKALEKAVQNGDRLNLN